MGLLGQSRKSRHNDSTSRCQVESTLPGLLSSVWAVYFTCSDTCNSEFCPKTMFCMFPSLRTIYFLELQGLNVKIEKDCVLSEVRSKFLCNLNESIFPRVGVCIYIYIPLFCYFIFHYNEKSLCSYIFRLSIFNQVSWPCLITATCT